MRAAVIVVCQTGPRDFDMVREAFQRSGVQGRVERFIDAMDREVNDAGLIVSRAGATTLAEITAAGRPSILIPLPTATDDHQRQNAEALEAAGAAEVIEQKTLDRRAAGGSHPRARRGSRARASRCRRRPGGSRGRTRRNEIVDAVIATCRSVAHRELACSSSARRFHFVGIGGIGMSGIAELAGESWI